MPLPAPGTAGQVHIIGAVGGLFVVEVPGPRDRRLSAWLDLPRSALSSTVTGRVHVRNVGRSSLYFWAEDRTSIAPGGQAGDDRVKRTFLPAGRQRSFPVTVTANGLGRAHVTVAVFHNRADSEVVQDLLAGDVWLLPPPYLIGGGGLLGLLAVGLLLLILLRRRRRRRSERPAAERASRRPARGGRSRVEEG